MKMAEDILVDIHDRFKENTNDDFEDGSVLDLFSAAISDTLEDVYEEIENNKNPHIWTKLEGKNLDDTGTWVGCPRETGESDITYKYRLMNWMLRNEASNTTAIQDALLNMQYASNAEFVPMTKGCGTGTVYVIPISYSDEDIANALAEAHDRINKCASPTPYIDFIIPTIKAVSLEVYMKTDAGDDTEIKKNLDSEIRRYVNAIAPKDYLKVGEINKMGVNTDDVEYFSIVGLIINGVHVNKSKVLQEIDSKFIFDEIQWIGDSDNDDV